MNGFWLIVEALFVLVIAFGPTVVASRVRNKRPKVTAADFESWCRAVESHEGARRYSLRDELKGVPGDQEVLDRETLKFLETIRDDIARGRVGSVIDVTTGYGRRQDIRLDLADCSAEVDLTASTKSQIYLLNLVQNQIVEITGGLIRTIIANPEIDYVRLQNCMVGKLEARTPTGSNTSTGFKLDDCWIGELRIHENSISDLTVSGGSIRSIRCAPPDGPNPITGSVIIGHDVEFPTSSKAELLGGAQGYRNFRSHLQKLGNSPATALMRSLELRTERYEEKLWSLSRFLGFAFDLCAKYGLSPGRPLLAMIGMWIVAAGVIFVWDGGAAGANDSFYSGWRAVLVEDRLLRSAILPIQFTVNPFGLFGLRSLVVASTTWGQVLLAVVGLAADAMIVMSVIAVRRRFKMS